MATAAQANATPWVVTPEALLPFRTSQQKRPEGDPPPLPYLLDQADQESGALDIELEVLLITPALKRKGLHTSSHFPIRGTCTGHQNQMIAHHTMGGCNLRPGDLFGSGTISAPESDGFGSILEATQGGTDPVYLASRRGAPLLGRRRRNSSPGSRQSHWVRLDRLRRMPGDDLARAIAYRPSSYSFAAESCDLFLNRSGVQVP